MKSLAIAHVDAEKGFSGGESQVFLLMEGLRDRGHACTLVCPPGSRAEAEASARGIPVCCVRMANDADLGSVAQLKREFERLQPDLVHLHTGRATWLGGLAARLAGLPAITTRRMDRRIRGGLRARLVYGPLVARAVAISPAVESALLAGGVAREVSVIASSVDPGPIELRANDETRRATRAALEVAEDTVVVLALAALVRRKGLDVLLESLARPGLPALGRVVTWIAGAGPELDSLRSQAVSLGVSPRVRFLGPRGDAADLLAGCDLLVLPSRREGLGVAALEAMAAGRAVVASRVGGLAQVVVDGRTGLLVEPEDPPALAEAIARLAGDAALREKLGRGGRERLAEGFLASQMVEAYEKLYRSVLEERRNP